MTESDWKAIRDMLNHDIQVWYVKDEEVNRIREKDKERTIDWIIQRLQQSPVKGGTRLVPPTYTHTFVNLYKPVAKAVRMHQPQCYMCRSSPTTEVHHIRPRFLKGSEYDPCNLVGLCEDCHADLHRALDFGITCLLEKSLE